MRKVEEFINDGTYEFETYELQSMGVVKARVRVKLGADFVRKFKEIVGDTAAIRVSYDNTMYFDTVRYFDRKVIEEAIQRAAVEKILREGSVKKEYLVVLNENDVDFTEIGKEVEKAKRAYELIEEIAREKKRLEDAKVVQDYYWGGIILINGERYDVNAYSVEGLEKILETLRKIDVNELLRSTIETQRKKIEELEQRIRELRAENKELRERLDRLEAAEEDDEDEDF